MGVDFTDWDRKTKQLLVSNMTEKTRMQIDLQFSISNIHRSRGPEICIDASHVTASLSIRAPRNHTRRAAKRLRA